MIYPGSLTREDILKELGLDENTHTIVYKSPERNSYPTQTAIRMDPNLTKVHTPDGIRLKHHHEMAIDDGYDSGCVYVEFRDPYGNSHYIIGRDEEDVDYQIGIVNENNKGMTQNMTINHSFKI